MPVYVCTYFMRFGPALLNYNTSADWLSVKRLEFYVAFFKSIDLYMIAIVLLLNNSRNNIIQAWSLRSTHTTRSSSPQQIFSSGIVDRILMGSRK